ncbi:MAG: hypothetical protein JXN64_14650 [Spirochaetes bacterium]|nr:hypothetical protein [Spirochaetota bacterium]
MNLRSKIFDSYAIAENILQIRAEKPDAAEQHAENNNIFMHEDPFDFFRKNEQSDQYIPVTQRGLRMAFSKGLSGIEFYIEMATSLRPLADEAQDIDQITRLLSQQKLTNNPNPHSVSILRNLIKDPNPEIALYAAEGLNTIENAFIEKIQRIKNRIKGYENPDNIPGNGKTDIENIIIADGTGNGVEKQKERKNNKKYAKKYFLYYLLGLIYFEFAGLLEGQHLIQLFYLKEAVSSLKTAHGLKRNNKRILTKLGESYMLMRYNKNAINIFTYLFSKNQKDRFLLLKLAECYYNTGDYQNVSTLANLASKNAIELDEISNLIIYQWLLNI